LEKVIDPDLAETKYFYDAEGNLERTELPNGVVENRTYDALNRLKLLEYKKNDVTLQSFEYTLDPVGHRQVVTELNGRKVEYEYDDIYRLRSEIIFAPAGAPERTISYGYDPGGNRLTKTDSVGGVTTYTYDDNDRLLKEELKQNGAPVGSVEYGYDNNGNTKTKTRTDAADNVLKTVTYSWNKENRLVGVSAPNLSVSYAYDADGVRVSSTFNGVTTEYLVDGNRDYAQVLEEYVNDALTASYVYGLDLISQERGNADSFYLVDGLGSTRGLTDASGMVTDTYNYDAFGNLIGVSGGTANNYRFAGEQFDPNLGDYYLRQRYYNPGVGRFTRRDTYEGSISDPITLHKYLYGNANPVTYTDPTGLFSAAEAQAAADIANTLAGIQWESGQWIINHLLGGEDPTLFSVGFNFILPLLGMASHLPKFAAGPISKLEKVWGTPDSKVLRENLKKAGVSVPKFPNAAHHIVPGTQNQPDAIMARTHLANLGIESNDAANGVFLEYRKSKGATTIGTGTIHNEVHTEVYFAKVRRRLQRATIQQEAKEVLQEIARLFWVGGGNCII
jgi:RHS repeat-associated protein